MTYVEDAASGLIIVVPDRDALARERVLGARPAEARTGPAPRRGLISRLFPRKARAGA